MMINIEKKHLKIVKEILSKYNYYFYIFGSRITPNVKKFSDIDILFFDNIPNSVLQKLEEDFEESNLPYKVDLVDYNKCSESFKEIIGKNFLLLHSSDHISK